MACPFCALGCRDGCPQPSEVSRNWRIRQLAVHPDHEGGSTEATIFLNQTKDYAMEYLSRSSKGKIMAINCPRHSTQQCGNTSKPFPAQFHPNMASTSADKYPPPTPPVAQAAEHHPTPPYPDPWASSEQAGKQNTQPHTAFTAPQPQRQPQQEPPNRDGTQPTPTAPQQTLPPSSKRNGWYKQTFRCRWCKSETVYQGHGSWPYVQALQEGWSKPAKRPWSEGASCKDCITTFYGYTATTAYHVPLPTPTLASPQPTSNFAW